MNDAFEPVDLHLAETLLRLSGSTDEELRQALLLLSYHTRNGHVCIDLRALPPGAPGDPRDSFPWRFIKALPKSTLVGLDRHRSTPLVVEGDSLLYFRRMREHELTTASRLRNLAMPLSFGAPDVRLLPRETETTAGTRTTPKADVPDPAARALELVLQRRLLVVTGGPGTGKTTVTAAVLAGMLMTTPGLRVALAAPTGKAAARLRDSLQQAFGRLIPGDDPRPAIPDVKTLHRLLGRRMHSASFLHNETNPLNCDLVVVDEASMIDLPLFAGLLAALPPDARLVLAGDRYQLASVEAGTVLGDLCSVTESSDATGSLFAEAGELARCILELEKNYRFGEDSGISRLAKLVRHGDDAAALALLRAGGPDLTFLQDSASAQIDMQRVIMEGFRALGRSREPVECLKALDHFRILCAHRRGPGGVEELNAMARDVLLAEGVLRRTSGGVGGLEPLPILITRNDHRLRLFNGDLGVLLHDEEGRASVHFPGDEPGGTRRLPPERLPEHELSFATTVHKSQGSEFEEALLVLPPQSSPVLTRELIYTAVTRARRRFVLRGSETVLSEAVRLAIVRTSGLRRALLSGTD